MEKTLILLLTILVGFIISLFFEEARELYSEVWSYIIGFEWWNDLWDLISSVFENIGEFSIYGLGFGLFAFGLIFMLRGWMIEPFVEFYSPTGRMFWTIATYLSVFVGGYFMGKFYESN